jgi:hypothetical protein
MDIAFLAICTIVLLATFIADYYERKSRQGEKP